MLLSSRFAKKCMFKNDLTIVWDEGIKSVYCPISWVDTIHPTCEYVGQLERVNFPRIWVCKTVIIHASHEFNIDIESEDTENGHFFPKIDISDSWAGRMISDRKLAVLQKLRVDWVIRACSWGTHDRARWVNKFGGKPTDWKNKLTYTANNVYLKHKLFRDRVHDLPEPIHFPFPLPHWVLVQFVHLSL